MKQCADDGVVPLAVRSVVRLELAAVVPVSPSETTTLCPFTCRAIPRYAGRHVSVVDHSELAHVHGYVRALGKVVCNIELVIDGRGTGGVSRRRFLVIPPKPSATQPFSIAWRPGTIGLAGGPGNTMPVVSHSEGMKSAP